MASMDGARVITPVFVPRIWGSRDLRPWFPDRGAEAEPVGEAWLTPPEAPVLVKLLFPRQRLSVQVHPDDNYAHEQGWKQGKNESWYVLAAEPDAQVALGLRPGACWEDLEAACRGGRAAELLQWVPVRAGDVVNVPAGTVHAIGPGSVLLEAQQPADRTFRLDDFGRGRELHLDHGLAVARATAAGVMAGENEGMLLETPYFRLSHLRLPAGGELPATATARWLFNRDPGAGNAAWPAGRLLEIPPGVRWRSPEGGVFVEIQGPN